MGATYQFKSCASYLHNVHALHVIFKLFFCFSFQKVEEIRKDIGDSRIWLSIDEATDTLGRYMANVIVGKLDADGSHKGHLLVAQLEKTNASTIVQCVQEALSKFTFIHCLEL